MNALTDWYPGDGVVFAALDMLGMIAVFVALAWTAERVLARRRAALSHALWLSALAGVLLTPALTLIGRQLPWHVTVLPADSARPHRPAEAPSQAAPPVSASPAGTRPGTWAGGQPRTPEASEPGEAVASRSDPVPNPAGTAAPASGATSPPPARAAGEAAAAAGKSPAPPGKPLRLFVTLALLIWGMGSVYLGARLLHGWWRVRGLGLRLRPLDGGRWAGELSAIARTLAVARLPEIYLSPDVRSPVVVGLFRARVILPEALSGHTTPRQFGAVLLHECAHVVRGDPWVRLGQCLAALLFWVHPLVYFLNRRLDRTREEVCDNHALAYTAAPAYAETLLTVAQICYPIPRPEGYLTMMPPHYTLERRVADLLAERRDTATHLSMPQRAALLPALVLLLAAVSSVGWHGAAAAQPGQANGASPQESTPKHQAALSATKLTGRVVHADSSPAAGATVWAATFTDGPLERRETVTDKDGRYTLDLDPGDWYVWARHGSQGGGGPVGQEPLAITAGRPPEPVTIRLEERGTLRGRLLEAETGQPIVGGRLFLDAGLVLTTGADGRFEAGGLDRGHHEAFVVAPGRLRLRVLFDTTARADTELDVPVPRGGKLAGRVTDPEGKPIPGAYVGRNTSGSVFSLKALFQACDAEGRFEYDGVTPDQPTRLSAFAPGYVAEERDQLRLPPDGKPLELNFRLRPQPGTRPNAAVAEEDKRRRVSGTVRGPDGKPVAGVMVRWSYHPFGGDIHTRTDADGRFRLTVPDQAGMLAVLPRDLAPEFPRVAAGGDKDVAVTLHADHTARGRVLDDTGKPIQDVRVLAVIPSPTPGIGNPFWLTEAAVRTDAGGRFHVKGIPDHARFDFLKPGLSDIRNYHLDLGGADNTVTMLYGGAVYGRVVDRDGKPIRNFRVLVGYPRTRQPGERSSGFFAGYSGIGVRFTSADGTFVLTGLGAESVYRITALAEGHGEAVADRVTAVPRNHLAGVEPVTLRAGPPAALRVRAVTTAGKPVAGARVTLVYGGPHLDRSFSWSHDLGGWLDTVCGRTAADGQARFAALGFGEAAVVVQAPGYARQRVGWRNGEKELTITLAPEAVLTGDVQEGAGKPVKAFYVSLLSGGDQVSTSAGPDDKGRFRVAELPAGTWAITIYSADGRSKLHEARVTLQAGEAKEIKVEVKKE